ncbi:ankyrin repeat-containing domain protein [Pilaira anomala]|nr:ankyrin repeat-containing domain protein [Pilaira anomala]
MLDDNVIFNRIDKLVIQFCDTSVQCESLETLHDCMESVLDDGYGLLETTSNTTIDSDTLFGSFENYIMDSTYDVAFFKITQLLLAQDKKLTKALEDMENLDFSQIGLPTSITDERNRVRCAISEFERIGSFRTPAEKLDCLLNTVSELTKDPDLHTSTFLLDSDSLIPLLLITLIRSKVPHLTANLIYMKISKRNVQYWSAIKTGDMNQIVQYDTNDAHDIRDVYGNNALMMACIHHQPKVIEYLLSIPVDTTSVTNDMNKTPLILAIEYGKSFDSVQLLLNDAHVIQSVNNTIDKDGNTAVLYACSLPQLDILKALIQKCTNIIPSHQINTITGDSMLHVASRAGSLIHIMTYIIQLLFPTIHIKNKRQQTFYHTCRNPNFIKYILIDPKYNAMDDILHHLDDTNTSPLMIWASEGRLDLIELVLTEDDEIYYTRVDKQGRSLLHLLALHVGKGLRFGEKSLDYIVEKFKNLVNVRDWVHGNTPLHIAASNTVLGPTHLNNLILFVKALVKHGSVIHAVNFSDEQPVNVCRMPEIISCLDGK